MINRTVLELLQKSQDGKAALMMRKAAELLVKVGHVGEAIRLISPCAVCQLQHERECLERVKTRWTATIRSLPAPLFSYPSSAVVVLVVHCTEYIQFEQRLFHGKCRGR